MKLDLPQALFSRSRAQRSRNALQKTLGVPAFVSEVVLANGQKVWRVTCQSPQTKDYTSHTSESEKPQVRHAG